MINLIVFLFLAKTVFATDSAVLEEKGSLKLTAPKRVDFPEIITNTATVSSQTALENNAKVLTLKDNRHSEPGWSLTVSGFNFQDSEDLSEITIDHLTVRPKRFVVIEGSAEGLTLGEENSFNSAGVPLLIARAEKGHGQGRYDFLVDLILEIPANSPAGKYHSTLLFTVQ